MPAEILCHNCGASGMDVFYEARDLPVHSCLLMPTREKARDYPRGNLRLGFCPKCGFIQNTVFDPGVHEYSVEYEETQAFSPTFNRFAHDLAQTLIDRYGIRGKDVLEIGCGKGEFLVLLCELGGNRGVGIDPGYRPERTRSEAASRIRFIQDFYSEKYSDLTGDLVVCRHTLEHIQPTLEFLRLVRRSIGDRRETVVCFELPDVLRVLKERAFWDIYYEHCSYFSLGSLARLFRSCDFELIDLYVAYADQYLIIDALPGGGSTGRVFEAENDLEALTESVREFRDDVSRTLDGWRDRLARLHREGKRAVIWGSGSKGVAFLTTLGIGDEVGCCVDINPYKHGKFMPGTGHEIVAPEFLKGYRPDAVLVMNPIYSDEIRADLRAMGLQPEIIPV